MIAHRVRKISGDLSTILKKRREVNYEVGNRIYHPVSFLLRSMAPIDLFEM
jgi:hypothetical protein